MEQIKHVLDKVEGPTDSLHERLFLDGVDAVVPGLPLGLVVGFHPGRRFRRVQGALRLCFFRRFRPSATEGSHEGESARAAKKENRR